jgi:nitroimidazol reductase NimA-like FMN-containing flavoprotein (pyridoxamine 5'-phosphate oxidase superfamily)
VTPAKKATRTTKTAARKPAEPKPSRMTSHGYGFEQAKTAPGKRFPWRRASKLLETARNYWIGTTGPQGRPHSAPVWGIWLDNLLYFSTGEESRKGRNLARNPRVTAHPELDNEAVIIEGTAERITDRSKLRRVWNVYNAKYDWDVEGYPFYVLRPRVAYSFKEDLPETATRWLFPKRSTRKRG